MLPVFSRLLSFDPFCVALALAALAPFAERIHASSSATSDAHADDTSAHVGLFEIVKRMSMKVVHANRHPQATTVRAGTFCSAGRDLGALAEPHINRRGRHFYHSIASERYEPGSSGAEPHWASALTYLARLKLERRSAYSQS